MRLWLETLLSKFIKVEIPIISNTININHTFSFGIWQNRIKDLTLPSKSALPLIFSAVVNIVLLLLVTKTSLSQVLKLEPLLEKSFHLNWSTKNLKIPYLVAVFVFTLPLSALVVILVLVRETVVAMLVTHPRLTGSTACVLNVRCSVNIETKTS